MMANCPYCNADLSAMPPRGTGRLLCPRCGEPLPEHVARDLPTAAAPLPDTMPPAALQDKPSRANRQVGLIVFGVMLLMAGIGLTYALLTVEYRRANDYRVKKGKQEASPAAPGAWTGIGYLPRGVNVVAAVSVSESLRTPATRKLLETPRPAGLDWLLSNAEKWTGLRVEDFDHLVAGTELKSQLPQLTIVIQTLKPYDPTRLAKALHPSTPTPHRGQPLFRFNARPGEGALWCVGPRTLVALVRLDALKTEDIEAIPLQPRKAEETLAPGLRPILERRVPKESVAWFAGDWAEAEVLKSLALLLPPDMKEQVETWSQVRAAALAIVPRDGMVVTGSLFTGDAKATHILKQRLDAWQPADVHSFKVETPPPEVVEPAEQWLSLQIRATAEQLRTLLNEPRGK